MFDSSLQGESIAAVGYLIIRLKNVVLSSFTSASSVLHFFRSYKLLKKLIKDIVKNKKVINNKLLDLKSKYLDKYPLISKNKGSINCIFGESGSGKTTVLKYLFCYFKRNNNMKIIYLDQYISAPNINLLKFYNFKKGYQLEIKEISALFEKLNLTDIEIESNINLSTLSSGQFFRINLARAILNDYEYIFIDEPFSSLDNLNAIKIRNLLFELKEKNINIFLTTHNKDGILSDNYLNAREIIKILL